MLTSRSLSSSSYDDEQVSAESSDSDVEYIDNESPRLVSLDGSTSADDSDESRDESSDDEDDMLLRARASLVSFRTQLVLTDVILKGTLTEVGVYCRDSVTIPTNTLMDIIGGIAEAIYSLDQKDIIDAVDWLKTASSSLSERTTVEASLETYQSILANGREFMDEMRALVNANAIAHASASSNQLRVPRSGSPTLFGVPAAQVASSLSLLDENAPPALKK